MATDSIASSNQVTTENHEDLKTFQERLADMPTYTMTLSQFQSLYTTLKERHEVLKKAFDLGEQYVDRFTTAAKPIVQAATTTALNVAEPVVGKIDDPVAKLDGCASEALAKVQEKLPFVKQTPNEIVMTAKSAVKTTADYYLGKVQETPAVKQASHQVDNAVSFSELMVEICFPTDGSNPDDIEELEKAEEDEDKGVLVRANNLKNRALRRGTRKLMSYQPVKTTVDNVQYAQTQIREMTEKLMQGTNFVVATASETKSLVQDNYPEIKGVVQGKVAESGQLLTKQWDKIYQSTMYIPRKALQVTGEVYISAQEMVFAYGKAHAITEMPHAIAEMVEKYYSNISKEVNDVDTVKEKAYAFVYVPAQVVSEYLMSSRAVQWIIPKTLQTERIEVVESEMSDVLNEKPCDALDKANPDAIGEVVDTEMEDITNRVETDV